MPTIKRLDGFSLETDSVYRGHVDIAAAEELTTTFDQKTGIFHLLNVDGKIVYRAIPTPGMRSLELKTNEPSRVIRVDFDK